MTIENGSCRIGLGFDLHTIISGRALMLGCVVFDDSDAGLAGHSDADVVSHAVCDALLGAVGLGDIGDHFPDTDPEFKDYPGSRFLERVAKMVGEKGYKITNVDCVVLSDAVKLGARKREMAIAMAKSLGLAADRVSVKATTCEGHDAVGRGEAIACHAVAMVVKSD